MIKFLIGFILGGLSGVFIMCMLSLSKDEE